MRPANLADMQDLPRIRPFLVFSDNVNDYPLALRVALALIMVRIA